MRKLSRSTFKHKKTFMYLNCTIIEVSFYGRRQTKLKLFKNVFQFLEDLAHKEQGPIH